MADAFGAFEGRYGGKAPRGGGGGNSFDNWETNFSIARLNPKNSQKAGGLNRLQEQQLATLGYKPSDIEDWNDLPERKQKKLEDVLTQIASKDKPYLAPGYKIGSISEKFKDNPGTVQDLGTWQGVKSAGRSAAPGLAEAIIKGGTDMFGFGDHSVGEYTEPYLRAHPEIDRANLVRVPGNREIYVDRKNTPYTWREPVKAGLNVSLMRGLPATKFLGAGSTAVGRVAGAGLKGGLENTAFGVASDILNDKGSIEGRTQAFDGSFGSRLENALTNAPGNFGIGVGMGSVIGKKKKTSPDDNWSNIFFANKELRSLVKEQNSLQGVLGVINNSNVSAQVKKDLTKQAKGLSETLAPKAENPLLAEARKYKSAEEFVNGYLGKDGYKIDPGGKLLEQARSNFLNSPEIKSLIDEQKSLAGKAYNGRAEAVRRTQEITDTITSKQSEGIKQQLTDLYNQAANKVESTPKTIAQDYTPEKQSVYKVLADNNVPQGEKFNAGVAAYKQAVPGATTKQASTAVYEVLADVNNQSVAGVRKGLSGVAPAVDTGIKNKGIVAKVRDIFNPIKNLGEDTQTSFRKSAGQRYAGQTERTTIVNELRDVAKKSGQKLDLDLAHQIENGTAPDNAFTRQFRAIADQLRADAREAGVDIGYRENYVPHIWKKSPEEVDAIARGAGMKPRAANERIIPTYQEGIDLGLKPKYKDPAEMLGDYVTNLQNARANVTLIKDLHEQGLLIEGRPPSGWKSVGAETFPRSANGSQLAAPKELADILDNIYGTDRNIIEKGLHLGARVNSIWQDIALAGGIPKTPANFFTFAQIMKEEALAAGHLFHPIKGAKQAYNPLAAFVTSFSKGKTASIQKANKDFLEDLARAGAPLNFSTGGKGWNALFNDPTFGRFMPTMQLGTAKNVFKGLEKKVGREEAMKQTAEIMKKMYGITDQLATGRSGAVQDAIGTIGFAPKYRESILNVLGNTARSIADPRTYRDQAFSLNRRLAVGMGVTFAIYNALNTLSTGHGLLQNPEGKELQLAIPYGKNDKGGQKVVYIPFMPSFMTLPRAAVGAAQSLAKGDFGGVGSEVGKLLSMPLQTGSQLISNTNYFGSPIVTDEKASRESGKPVDNGWDMLKKRGLYLAGQGSPALVRAGLDYFTQNKPLEQVLATAGEAPVRFGNFYSDKKNQSVSPGQITGDFYDKYSMLEAQSRATEKGINKGKFNGVDYSTAYGDAQKFNGKIDKEFADFFKKYGDQLTPDDRAKYERMLDSIKVDVRKNKTSDKYYINKY